MGKSRPPKFADRLLGFFIKGELLEEVLGDLYEYHAELSETPSWKRPILYWFHVLNFIRPELVKKIAGKMKLNNLGMIQLMFKLSFRHMRKKMLMTAISLITLITGVLSFQLTFSWLRNEISMDDFHENRDRIAIGVARLSPESNLIAFSISGLFQIDYSEYPEIEKSLLIHTYMRDEIKFYSDGVAYGGKGLIADSTFFDFFDFKLQVGTNDALTSPTNVIVTKEFADKVFGDEDPMGKIIEITCDQKGTYQVAGILDKIPSNSSIKFDFLIPKHSKNFWRRAPQDFIMLKQGSSLDQLNNKLRDVANASERFKNSEAFAYPFKDVFEEKPFNVKLFAKYGNAGNLKTVTLIAWALLFITIICYTNLQTSVQVAEMNKVKLKHIIGASKRHLVVEWMIRGFIYFLIATASSLILYHSIFNGLVNFIGLELDMQPLNDSLIIAGVILIAVLLSSLIASSNVFRRLVDLDVKKEKTTYAIGLSRRILAVFQYAITVVLLIGSVIVALQLRFMQNKDLGIHQTEIVSTSFFDVIPDARQDSAKRAEIERKHKYVIDRLSKHPSIQAVSQAKHPLGFAYDLPFKLSSSSDDFIPVKTLNTDPGFFKIFNPTIIEGRYFDETDENNAIKLVINESAKKFFKIQNIEETRLTYKLDNESYQIVGVVEDFHFEHLSQEIQPLILIYFTRLDNEIIVRYRNGRAKETLEFVEEIYREVNPEGIFTASFFEGKVASQYAKEVKVGRLYSIFGFIAILLSSVTLFSFVYHETNRRTKEVGVRKVNGASPEDIFKLFSLSFLKTILVALIASIPLGWYAMEQWLGDFSNRIEQELWMYVLITAIVLVWALIAIFWHTLKVAKLNPIQSLRYE
ncbi:ABC transporter permease [Ekhidna sp. To15]|uniref:ABC transporter permease n=1 Tax=Ekhidna sp. To15 TaxID=3395267 RepID=UPI003F5251E1